MRLRESRATRDSYSVDRLYPRYVASYLKRGFIEAREGPPRIRRLKLGRGDGSGPSVGVHVRGHVEPKYAVLRQRA